MCDLLDNWERQVRNSGETRGELNGKLHLVVNLFCKKFGIKVLEKDTLTYLQHCNNNQLDQVGESIFEINNEKELQELCLKFIVN